MTINLSDELDKGATIPVLKMKVSKAVACTLGILTVKPTNCFNCLEENVINFPALQLLNSGTCVFLKGQLLFSFHNLFLSNILSGNL